MKNVVLITRPEEDSAALAYAVNQKGFPAFCEPFLDVIFYEKEIRELDKYAGVIFTSANGVRAFVKNNPARDMTTFSVGDHTASELRAEGFKNVKSAKGDVSALAALIAKQPATVPYLYICGNHTAKDLPALVETHNIIPLALYHTEKIDKISENCRNLFEMQVFSHVLFFSKRTAENFVDSIENEGLQGNLKATKALCLGDSMVECLSVLPWADIIVAKHPNRNAMLERLEKNAGEQIDEQ